MQTYKEKEKKGSEKITIWEDLQFQDDFIFRHVLNNKELLKKFLNKLLNKNIDKLENIDCKNIVEDNYIVRGIRADINGKSFERETTIQMQVLKNKCSEKLAYYYQSVLDNILYNKTDDSDNINDTIVILICCYDPFDIGDLKYNFGMYCKNIKFDDGQEIIYFNTKCKSTDESEELFNLIKFIDGENTKISDLIEEIKSEVKNIKSSDILKNKYIEECSNEKNLFLDEILIEI